MQIMSLSMSAWRVSKNGLHEYIAKRCSVYKTNKNFPSHFLGVCKMYEEHLKRMNPNSPSITYDISQLFDFIDDLADLSCLV